LIVPFYLFTAKKQKPLPSPFAQYTPKNIKKSRKMVVQKWVRAPRAGVPVALLYLGGNLLRLTA
jgi:hypothetical protein